MKILLVHSYLYSHGGDSIYTLRLGELLSSKGHEVAYFGMASNKNIFHKYSNYEIDEVDYEIANQNKSIKSAMSVFIKPVYSFEAKRKIAALLSDFNPDIVHLQSIHYHITTSKK